MRKLLILVLAGFIINLTLTLLVSALMFGSAVPFIYIIILINMFISVFVIVKNNKLRCSSLGPILAIIAAVHFIAPLTFSFFIPIPMTWDTQVGWMLLLLGISVLFNLASAIAYFRLYSKTKKLLNFDRTENNKKV